jgi:cardiolipin synthase A/B
MGWTTELGAAWHYGVLGLTVLLAVLASGHALLFKRDSRAAAMWVGFVWFAPLVGPVLYFVLGVNRLRRRAVLLRRDAMHRRVDAGGGGWKVRDLEGDLVPEVRHLTGLGRLLDRVVPRPLVAGNRVEVLVDGDAAYPAMWEAIRTAERSVALSTYIFDRDAAGMAFAKVLSEAVRRGVEARVLVDATGARYSVPSILGVLRRGGVPHARFLPSFPLWSPLSLNLRNHRKLLVVDGRVGFTGGMNIRVGHWMSKQPSHPVRDLHFRVEGPVVGQLQEVFAEDWVFAAGESLGGADWFPVVQPAGTVVARGIADGPDEDLDKLRWAILAGLAAARRSIRVATPYFLPDPALISALNVAAMRGVAVDILLPEKGNLPVVQWASQAHWWQVLEWGCRLWLSPPPFDHSKLLVVDDGWCLVGSANWDPRSLRLNFEFNLECYSVELAAELGVWFDDRLRQSRRITLEEADARSLPVRLRDGAARLLTPFL